MSLTLFLLNKKGLKALERIVENGLYIRYIDKVIISKDKGNKEDCYEVIKKLALNHSLKVFDRKEVFSVDSEYCLAIGWKWMLNIEYSKLIVIHDSLLPKYRGFSPLVNMLIKKEEFIGATMIFANNKMDEGDIIFQRKIKVEYPIKIKKAIDLISNIYGDMTVNLLELLSENITPSIKKQISENATYSIWRDEDDYFIDWTQDAESIKRFVDSVGYPYANSRTRSKKTDKVIIITSVEVISGYLFELNHSGKVFKIEDGCPLVICGKDALKITEFADEDGNFIKINKLRTRFV